MNSVTIVGRMACEPESKAVGGSSLCEFRIGENTYKVDKTTGKKISYFWTIKAWGKVGETIQTYCHQGDQVILSGSIELEKWVDKTTGHPREKAVINANQMEFGAKPTGEYHGKPGQNPPGYGPNTSQRSPARPPAAPPRPSQREPEPWDVNPATGAPMDEEVAF